MAGKHRAEDQPDNTSTSERTRGKGSSDQASQSKHRPKGTVVKSENANKPAGSDLPKRGEGL